MNDSKLMIDIKGRHELTYGAALEENVKTITVSQKSTV